MKKIEKKLFFLVFLSSMLASNLTYAQNVKFKKTQIVSTTQRLQAVVESAPNNSVAHENYIRSFAGTDDSLTKQYERWSAKFPNSAIVPFAIGEKFHETRVPEGEIFLIKAIHLDSTLAKGYKYLADYEALKGNTLLAVENMTKAKKFDPKNAEYAFTHAYLFKDLDSVIFDSLMLDVAYRFPNTNYATSALYLAASSSFNLNEKVAYYETIYNLYSKKQMPGFNNAMIDYYDYLLSEFPEKAFDLALKMVLTVPTNRGVWKEKYTIARGFTETKKALNEGNAVKAIELANKIHFGNEVINFVSVDEKDNLMLLKAETLNANNNTKMAFDSLLVKYTSTPTVKIRNALFNYGKKAGLDTIDVDSVIAVKLNEIAWPQTNFTLRSYTDKKSVSLSDFRGKVVLLTYYFPSCPPCLSEFTHFESVLKKFKNSEVVYLAINIDDNYEYYVVPQIINKAYTFIPLQDEVNKSKGNLPKVQVFPTNFLIDKEGCVVFSNFFINSNNESSLELMITELLRKKASRAKNPDLNASFPLKN